MHVVVNAATSVDGKLSTHERRQVRISGDEDFERVDRLRAQSDGVMVGVGTVLADDPSLLRHDEAHRRAVRGEDATPPARVVADTRLRTPADAEILDGEASTYILHGSVATARRQQALRTAGARLVEAGDERVALDAALEVLEADGIKHLMVEGGGELIFSLFDAGLVDELFVYVGSLVIGGRDAPTLSDGEGFVSNFPALELREVKRLDDGVVLSYTVRHTRG
jgi:2,5-diamino-6-(ribosylamino)-4(3H)-pyrimidinone 5'-phosphate reductase